MPGRARRARCEGDSSNPPRDRDLSRVQVNYVTPAGAPERSCGAEAPSNRLSRRCRTRRRLGRSQTRFYFSTPRRGICCGSVPSHSGWAGPVGRVGRLGEAVMRRGPERGGRGGATPPRFRRAPALALVMAIGSSLVAACGSDGGLPTLTWYINPDPNPPTGFSGPFGQAGIAARCSTDQYKIKTEL